MVMGPAGALCGAHGTHTFDSRPGHHLPPQALSSGKEIQTEFGTGFTLLAFGANDAAINAIEASAKSHGVPVKVVRDTFEGGRELYQSKLTLVRPDQFVAWAGDSAPADVDAVIKRVIGA